MMRRLIDLRPPFGQCGRKEEQEVSFWFARENSRHEGKGEGNRGVGECEEEEKIEEGMNGGEGKDQEVEESNS